MNPQHFDFESNTSANWVTSAFDYKTRGFWAKMNCRREMVAFADCTIWQIFTPVRAIFQSRQTAKIKVFSVLYANCKIPAKSKIMQLSGCWIHWNPNLLPNHRGEPPIVDWLLTFRQPKDLSERLWEPASASYESHHQRVVILAFTPARTHARGGGSFFTFYATL